MFSMLLLHFFVVVVVFIFSWFFHVFVLHKTECKLHLSALALFPPATQI